MAINIELMNKNIVVASSKTTSTHTGTTAETILSSVLIPANSFIEGDEMIYSFLGRTLLTNGIKSFKFYLNTVNNLSGTPVQIGLINTTAGAFGVRNQRTFTVENATTLKNSVSGTQNLNSDIINNGTYSTFTVDLTVNLYLVISGTLANAADSVIFESVKVKRERF